MPEHFRPQDIHLRPGEYAVAGAGRRIRTLLGSCVSIILWQPARRVGAMSHFILAQRGSGKAGPPDARYGEEALQLMLAELAQRGIAPAQCTAKVFGGGNMFPGQALVSGPNVGRRNGEAARELLAVHGIPVLSENLFGVGHRQIVFEVASGDVWVRQSGVEPTRPQELS